MDQEILEKTKALAISGDQNVPSSPSSNPSSSRTAAASINLNPDASLVVPRRRSGLPPRPPPSPETRDHKNAFNWSLRSSNWLVDSCQIGSNWRGPPLSADSSQSGPDRRGSKISNESNRRGGKRSAGSSQVKLLPDEIAKKIVNQVEFYFSDINLVTTELLRKFINIDRDGFVPISVVASFKKIRDLVTKYSHNKNSVTKHLLAYALQSSSQLVVSKNGQKVRRKHGINDLYVKELQSRIIVAEDFPPPMARYVHLMKFFCTAGRVKSIRTCYPPTDPVIAKISEKPGIHLRSKVCISVSITRGIPYSSIQCLKH
ncbi:la-related protein 6B-like isoform X2 [Asparagus officinalis]|uniref:la-related protein 6B-like isoform X2 n=1 Tax=Asparagus officinalis TaxID=4686 RepID=UPI00098E07F2|nr:la-related protein 6B-like isoform X2 [Asparagus officinalis]